jgi:hypothetical protein
VNHQKRIMKLSSQTSALLLLLVNPAHSQGYGGGGGGDTGDGGDTGGGGDLLACTGVVTMFPAPSEGSCLPWSDQEMEEKIYPDGFSGILNKVEIYQCPSSGKRVIISNGIPDHDLTLQTPSWPCEVNWAIEVSDEACLYIYLFVCSEFSSQHNIHCRCPYIQHSQILEPKYRCGECSPWP